MLPIHSTDRAVAQALRRDAGDARRLASTFHHGRTASDLNAFAKALEQQARKVEAAGSIFNTQQDSRFPG